MSRFRYVTAERTATGGFSLPGVHAARPPPAAASSLHPVRPELRDRMRSIPGESFLFLGPMQALGASGSPPLLVRSLPTHDPCSVLQYASTQHATRFTHSPARAWPHAHLQGMAGGREQSWVGCPVVGSPRPPSPWHTPVRRGRPGTLCHCVASVAELLTRRCCLDLDA